uniref:SMODS and SLOG-associating 2TM effector domain-containing protein n=1 Tax=Entomoneis paludosa TaxID=265537 RepID=A0A7S3DT55_9STRA|mmetsp:Transcript_35308/g.73499  ORF Transcript_35308/g.73499 Transcript_35308/m.73499 type:complete len:1230 (+) Transcript_35308:179-3868(+)
MDEEDKLREVRRLPPPSLASDTSTLTTNYTFPQAPIPPFIQRAPTKDSAFMSEMTPAIPMNPWPGGDGFDDSYLAGPSEHGYENDDGPRHVGDVESHHHHKNDTENEMSTNPPPSALTSSLISGKDTEEPSTMSATTGKYYEIDFQQGEAQVHKKIRSPERVFSDAEDIKVDKRGSPSTKGSPKKHETADKERKSTPQATERRVWDHLSPASTNPNDSNAHSSNQSAASTNVTGPPLPPPSLASHPSHPQVHTRVPTDVTAGESIGGYSAGVSAGNTHQHTYSDASSMYLGPLASAPQQIRHLTPTSSQYIPPASIKRTQSTESKLPQLSVADRSVVMAPKNPTRQKKCKLQEGRFSLDDGSTKRFVYVPAKYNFLTKDGFDAILQALGMSSKPDVAFQVGDCFSVVPNSNQHEIRAYYQELRPRNYEGAPQNWIEREDLKFAHPSRDYFDILTRHNRVRSILDAIATECTTATTPVFVLNSPHRGNELAEFALDAALHKGIKSLGLFHDEDFTCLGGVTELNEELESAEFDEVDMNQFLERGFEVPWDKYWSKRRQKVPKEMFKEKDFVTDLHEDPNEVMQIHCQRSKSEKAFQETYRFNVIKNGLADTCSHLLVFESKQAKNEFHKIYTNLYAAGIIVAGSNVWSLEKAFECLQQNRPIFILEHTGAASNAVAELVRFGAKIEDFRNAGSRLSNPKFVDPLAVDSYIHAHFPPYDRRTELAMDDNIWEYARVIAHNFLGSAPHFSWRSNAIIDVGAYVDVNSIQDDVARVINSISERSPEIGGPAKDFQALFQAKSMMDELARAKRRYRMGGALIQFSIRLMILIAVAFGIALGVSVDENEQKKLYQALRCFAIVLPLIASVMITLEATVRPSLKYGLLLLAEKRIESEMYRFRTMTGIYRRSGATDGHDATKGTRNRTMFMERCEEIIESCFESDVGTGSLFSMTTKKNDVTGMFNQENGPASNESSPWTREAVQKIVNKKGRDDGWSNEKLKIAQWFRLKKPAAEPHRIVSQVEYDAEMGKGHADPSDASSGYAPVSTSTLEKIFVSADGYLEKRIVNQLSELHGAAPYMATLRMYLKFFVIVLTASSSVLASFEKAEWIPLPLAIAAALEFVKDYMQLDTRVPTINGAAGELTKVWLWWTGLSLAQARLSENKDLLVDRSERAILAQYEHFAGQVVSALRRRHDQGVIEAETVVDVASPRADRERKRFQDITTERKKFRGEESI